MADDIALSAMVLMSMKASGWMREWLRKRYKYGSYYQLLKEVQLLDISGFRNFL